MEISGLIEAAKKASGCESDSAFAARMKVTRASVSNWKSGRNYPDAVTCAKIAEITGVPLARVLGIVGEARAISREEKAVWRRLASAAAIACLMLGSLPSQAHHRGGMNARPVYALCEMQYGDPALVREAA